MKKIIDNFMGMTLEIVTNNYQLNLKIICQK